MSDELPQGWAMPLLGEVVKIKQGNSKLTKKIFKPDGKYVAFSGSGPDGLVDEFEHEGKAIVLSAVGARCGKCFKADGQWTSIANTAVIRPFIEDEAHFDYLFYLLNNENFWPKGGTAQPFVQTGLAQRETRMPLAPLAEQRRIVAKLEKLLGKVDACQQRLEKMPTLLKRFRQSILAAACSGRLTADWRELNGGDGYESTTVEAIAEYVGGFAYKSPTFLESGNHQVIRIGNVRPLALKLDASPVFIPEDIAAQTERFKLLPDDIAISMTGTKYKRDYGCASLVTDFDGSLFLNQRVARVRCGKTVLPKFLLFWFQTDLFRDFFFSGETGNVNQGNVGAGGIRSAPLELPPLAEQQEIVRRVAGLFALADQLELRLAQARGQVAKLTPSLLARAFAGKLVPQNPADEPAEKLLERIKSNHESKSHKDARK